MLDLVLYLRPHKQVRRDALGRLVARWVRGSRRARAEIEHLGALLAGAVHKCETDAVEARE
jgi:hypothetical protein